MTLDFLDETNGLLSIGEEQLAKQVILASLDVMNCPYEAAVGLTITDESGIRRLNQNFRNIDRPTDVLSFPMTEFDPPGDFSGLESMEAASFDPESGELLLGDIVICAQKVLQQAADYGHSVTREYAFLLTHSILHLLGFDHTKESDTARMEELQREILGQLKIFR